MVKRQPFTVHQFHHTVGSKDAVTNHLLLIQESLRQVGIAGEIFAKEKKNAVSGIRSFSLEEAWNCDLFLIHHSHGNPALREILRLELPKAIVYHNITPSRYFRHDPFIAALCESGRTQLLALRDETVGSFAVSQFNADELSALGYSNPGLLPLLDLSDAKMPKKRARARKKSDPIHLLFVGRLSRHKNQALLIETFYFLKPRLPRHSKLFIIGAGDPVYRKYLELLIKKLSLSQDVILTGAITEQELKHHYENADAFLCGSEHEGFCVPLVEAMRAGVPIFAIPRAAIGETLGDAGIHLKTSEPHEIAEIVATVLASPKALTQVLSGQAERFQKLKEFQNRATIRSTIQELLEQLHPVPNHPTSSETAL